MSAIVFALEGGAALAEAVASRAGLEIGRLEQRRFPDGETWLRIGSEAGGRVAVVFCPFRDPDARLVPLALAASACRERGASRVMLVAPYFPYLRQDTRFGEGEPVAARVIGGLLSQMVDAVVTVEPHLHRLSGLAEILTIPARAVAAAGPIAEWIASEVDSPVVVGPDGESEPWVREVARRCAAPWLCLHKTRLGDREVRIELPRGSDCRGRTVVLVDDIVSTAGTMAKAATVLQSAGAAAVAAIAVHAIFAPGAEQTLRQAGVSRIVSCDTIAHPSNAISIVEPLTAGVAELVRELEAT